MIEVVSTKLMRDSDEKTIAGGTTERELMQRAAEAVFKCVKWKSPIAIVCGCGNNAGDGFALANILHEKNYDCEIFLMREKFSKNGKYFFEICKKTQIKVNFCEKTTDFGKFSIIVDCIFGTGFSGEVEGLEKDIIEKINNSNSFVVSVDINSGLNADSGMAKTCVKSNLTCSIGSYKAGHFLNMAKDVIGSLKNLNIGIKLTSKPYFLLEQSDAKRCYPTRQNFSHKGNYGYIALIGGSKKYSGAEKLANLACSSLAAGAGVVRLAVAGNLASAYMPYMLESTLFPLFDDGGEIKFKKDEIDELVGGTAVVALGMGVGVSDDIKSLTRYLLENYEKTLVLDADGLNCLSEMDLKILKNAKCKVVLTPHLKEFSRLTKLSVNEILQNPIEIAKDFAKAYNVTLLLKGTTTITSDGEEVYLTNRGTAGMATAGSGDVLTGIIAALCATNPNDLALAAASGSFIAGYAGELASKKYSDAAMTSSDTISFIKTAVSNIEKSK